jgi:hypothetical protein
MSLTRALWILTLTGLLIAAAAAAEGPDLSGTWMMTIEGKTPPGKNFSALTFEGAGDELTVVLRGKPGELRSACELDGDAIRFEHAPPGKKSSLVVFRGSVHGDLMGGEVDMGARGTSKWEAIRDGEGVFDLSGTWTFFQKGLPRDYVNLTKLRFSQDGPELVATFTTGDVETVCRGHLDGAAVDFAYSRPLDDGKSIAATYRGKIGGDRIQGEVDMGAQGQSTWYATRDDE